MKITDLSIESNNIQIEYLSEQEANKVSGGFTTMGVPGEGGEPDESCITEFVEAIYSAYTI